MPAGQISLHPSSGQQPGTTPASWKRIVDTNHTKSVIEYADAVEYWDWNDHIPANWASGGTLYVIWRANSATTNAWRVQVQCISGANAEASDPAFNTADLATLANAAATANIWNIDSIVLANGITGWAIREALLVRLGRLGTDGADSLSGIAVQVVDAWIEYD